MSLNIIFKLIILMKLFYILTLIIFLPNYSHQDDTNVLDNQLEQVFDSDTLQLMTPTSQQKPISSETPSEAEQNLPQLSTTQVSPEPAENLEQIQKQIPEVLNDHNGSSSPSSESSFSNFIASKKNDDNHFGEEFIFEENLKDDDILDKNPEETLSEILNEFQGMNCHGNYKQLHQAKNYLEKQQKFEEPSFCSAKIKQEIFTNLQNIDSSPSMLSNWISKFLYRPLGYNQPTKFSFPEVINSFLDVEKNTMIHPEMQIPNNRDFLRMVMKTFETIENASSDFINNKGQISNLIIDLLKKFHIFWNVHRQRKQMDNLHENTLLVLKKMLTKYKQTSNAMKAITLHVLQNIKGAYERFQKASTMQKEIVENSAEMIAVQILRRVKNNYENIHLEKSNYQKASSEIAYLIDLLTGFYLINYKNKIDNEKNILLYKKYIFDKIKEVFENYKPFIEADNAKALYDFKDWTAILLLKFEHKTFMIFTLIGIDTYQNLPIFTIQDQTNKAHIVKLYYEIQDRLLFLPQECLSSLSISLRSCMESQIGKILNRIYNSYFLYQSIAGENLMSFLRSNKDQMLEKMDKSLAFENYNNFRNLFYSNLFLFMRKFASKYRIQEISSLKILENEIGEFFEKLKNKGNLSEINLKLVSELDKTIYENFLDIKAKYNQQNPMNDNPLFLQDICESLNKTIQIFRQKKINQFNADTEQIQQNLIEIIEGWRKSLLQKSVEGTDNYLTPSTMFVPVTNGNADIVSNYVHEPVINSLKIQPTFGYQLIRQNLNYLKVFYFKFIQFGRFF